MKRKAVALFIFAAIVFCSVDVAQAKKPRDKTEMCEVGAEFTYSNVNGEFVCKNICPVRIKTDEHNRKPTWACEASYTVNNKLRLHQHVFTRRAEYHSYRDEGNNTWFCPIKKDCSATDMLHTDELCVDYRRCNRVDQWQPIKKRQ